MRLNSFGDKSSSRRSCALASIITPINKVMKVKEKESLPKKVRERMMTMISIMTTKTKMKSSLKMMLTCNLISTYSR